MKRGFLVLAVAMGLASGAWAGSDSGLEIRLDGGLVSPASGILHENFTSSSSFGGSLGYRFGWFAILLDAQYNSLNSLVEGSNVTFNTLEGALVEKARLGALTSIKPFVFLGEGLAVSSLSGSSTSESDPLLEAGLGLDFVVTDHLSFFLQTKGDFILSSTQAVVPEKLAILLPYQLGMNFSL